MQKKLTGIIPPIITPFDKDEEVDYQKLEYNIQKWNKTGLSGYLVLGSNGEAVSLNRNEKVEIIKKASNFNDDKAIIFGSSEESTKNTIELTNELADAGGEIALLLPPFYYKGNLNDSIIIEFYKTVANNVKVPIMIYNVPKYTGIDLSPELIIELSKHKNIIGIKDSTGNVGKIGLYIKYADSSFNVLVGTANAIYTSLILGAQGGILALANLAPKKCVEIYNLVQNNQLEEAKNLQLSLIASNIAVTGTYGIPGLKYAMNKLGYKSGHLRKPLTSLTQEQKNDLEKILIEANLIKN